MTPANLSIFVQDYAPRTTRVVQTPDGSAQVYSALAIGRIEGRSRTIPALVCEEVGEEDRWYLVNLYVNKYFDTVAVLGATSSEQAQDWAKRQVLAYQLAGDGAYCCGDAFTASADALQEYLDSAAAGVSILPIRQPDIDAFEGKITDRPVVWDKEWLKSHTAADLLHELARRDREGQMMDAMCKDDLPKVVEQMDGIIVSEYDAIIVDYNRLELMQERLMAAMAKASVGNVKPVNVTQTKPFKRNGVTNVAVLFEMDDGQTVTIVFHSPDATPAKLSPKDTLTSWKFMLNKRDVTAAVAPDNGENVQLPALAKRILLLTDKNSARFKRTNGKKAEQTKQLADTNDRITQKTATLESINAEIDSLQKQMDASVAAPTAEVPVAVSAAESSDYPLGKVENVYESRFFGTRVVVAADPGMPGDSEWQGTIYWVLNDGRLFEIERDGRPGSRIRVSGNRIKVLDLKDSKSTAAQANDGRLTPETAASLKAGDVVKTADGTEYMALSARHDWLEVAPIVNGKAQVNNQDTFKFLLSPEKASAYPERRNEPVYLTGRNLYAEQDEAKKATAGIDPVDNMLMSLEGDMELRGRIVQAASRMNISDVSGQMVENWYQANNRKFLSSLPIKQAMNAAAEFKSLAVASINRIGRVMGMNDNDLYRLAMYLGYDEKTARNPDAVTAKAIAEHSEDLDKALAKFDAQPSRTAPPIDPEDISIALQDALVDVEEMDLDLAMDFDPVVQNKRFRKEKKMSGFLIMQDTTDAKDGDITEMEMVAGLDLSGSVIPFYGRKRTAGQAVNVTGSDPESLRTALVGAASELVQKSKQTATQAVSEPAPAAASPAKPTYAPEPDALSLTPKQYHEALLAKTASDTGASMAEVRDNYDNEAERSANEGKWVAAVRQAAKDGKTISRATLDKLDEIRPGAVGSLMHDYPNASIPHGYQLPGARKAEAADKPNKKFDGYIKMAADSLDKLRLSDIDRVLDQAATKDEMLQLATYMVSRRPGIRNNVLQSFKDVLIENGWNKAFREVPNAPKEIPTNSTDAVKHLKRLFNVLEKAGVKVGLRPDDRKTLRFSVVTAGRDTVSGQMSMGYVLSSDRSWSVDGIRLSPITNQAEKTVLKIMQDAALWLNGEKIDFKSDAFSEDKTWAANSPLGAKWQADIVDAARSASEKSQEPAAAPAAPAQSAAPAANPDADFLNAVIAGTPPDMPPKELTAKLRAVYQAAKDAGNAEMLALGDKAIRAYAAQTKAKAQAKLAEVQ